MAESRFSEPIVNIVSQPLGITFYRSRGSSGELLFADFLSCDLCARHVLMFYPFFGPFFEVSLYPHV